MPECWPAVGTAPAARPRLDQHKRLATHLRHPPLQRGQRPPQIGQHRARRGCRALRGAQTVLQPSLLHHQRLDVAANRAQTRDGSAPGLCQAAKGMRWLYSARTTASAASVFERRSVCANRFTSLGFSTATSIMRRRIQRQRQIQGVNAGGLQTKRAPWRGRSPSQPRSAL